LNDDSNDWFIYYVTFDSQDEEEEEEKVERRVPRERRVTYNEEDEDEEKENFSKRRGPRSKRKERKERTSGENRSFFPNGKHPNSSKTGALGGGAGSNNALVRSLLAQSLKQPLRNKIGFSSLDGIATLGGYQPKPMVNLGYGPNSTASIGSATPLATELTRASRTYLSQRGEFSSFFPILLTLLTFDTYNFFLYRLLFVQYGRTVGFTDVLSDSVAPVSRVPRMPLPLPRRVNLDSELRDKLGE
jgi:hypothetical protein